MSSSIKHRSVNEDPLWFKDAVIYEVHVKAFRDSNGDGVGDFRGLAEKLDYIAELGVNLIWLLPFYPSPFKDDGYDISDYRSIHPSYGSMRDFKMFIREAHRRNIRVLTELVVNHTSDQHPWFQAARAAAPGSPQRDFYVWSDTDTKFPETRIIFCDSEPSNWTWDPVANQFYWHRFFHHQPDLNHNNPKVTEAVIKVLRYWLDMGVDGFRLDAVPYLCVREGTNNENLPETHDAIKRIRREVDEKYQNRVLLAEANQWPEDVRPYFGEGDECHMAYHFPLMPRIFIALAQENREPIVEIMQRTPDIPENCQWALFLRNHDELTLEMVSEEERDYLWKEYAAEPQMRLNLGIRRRLAPLVNNSVRRLELLNSLLFSFPGSPIIYYGDELGMGDNIYLGDRNGVRTPMQWSGNRNAGFSEADPARLYLPVIMDSVYGYERVNVEAQERDRSSFLNFMRRMIGLRRQYKAFGRGTIEFLHPSNNRVLAYLRCYRNEVLLCVVNLSRFPQPVELDLQKFVGHIPMELFGAVEFPRISERPYVITLGPHSFYWFRLEPEPEPLSVDLEGSDHTLEPPTLPVGDSRESLFDVPSLKPYLDDALVSYLRRQRWFGGKTRTAISGVRIRDRATLGVKLSWALIDVQYEDGGTETYSLLLKVVHGEAADTLTRGAAKQVVALLKYEDGMAVLVDALADRTSCQNLLSLMYNGRKHKTLLQGELRGRSAIELERAMRGEFSTQHISPILSEQSNSSIVFDKRLILKFFRSYEEEINPDLEISRYLSEETSFSHVPQLAGWLEYSGKDGSSSTIGVLHAYVENDGDGWEEALSFGRAFYAQHPEESQSQERFSWCATVPPELVNILGSGASFAGQLGQRTAELHTALCSGAKAKEFRVERVSASAIDQVAGRLSERMTGCRELLHSSSARLASMQQELATVMLGAASQLNERVEHLRGTLHAAAADGLLPAIRIHGDFHLGQTMKRGDDIFIFDFEGEPLYSIRQRRKKMSPLKDVAGMVRSLRYAAHAAVPAEATAKEQYADYTARRRMWADGMARVFVDSYRHSIANCPELEMSEEIFEALLEFYIYDKEVYELEYELNYRPDWIHCPMIDIIEHLADDTTAAEVI